MAWIGKAKGRAGDKKNARSRTRYDELRAAQGALALEMAAQVHNGQLTYGEAEAQLARVKAGPQYKNITRAEREAATDLHSALTTVDVQQTQTQAEGVTKQAAYAEQRRAYTEEFLKGERVRLELVEAAKPKTITNAPKPKGLTP